MLSSQSPRSPLLHTLHSGDAVIFDIAGFRHALDRCRVVRRVQWKTVAKETGVSASTLSRMANGRKPDAASMAALCAWAGIDHRKYLTPDPEQLPRVSMDTNLLMSSLREMVTADIHVQMIAAGAEKADAESLATWQEQYSRHETVVREQLLMLGQEASRYKETVRYR